MLRLLHPRSCSSMWIPLTDRNAGYLPPHQILLCEDIVVCPLADPFLSHDTLLFQLLKTIRSGVWPYAHKICRFSC